MFRYLLLTIYALLTLAPCSNAQMIKGVVQDRDGQLGLGQVQIYNVRTKTTSYGDSTGHFSIAAGKGDEIEMRKEGYRITRFRIPKENIPTHFRIYMEQIVIQDKSLFAANDPMTADSSLQTIRGVIQDRDGQAGLDNVQLYNVHTNTTSYGDSTGHFEVSAGKGQLIEMRKAGYRIARVRIPRGYIPSYFRIYMEKVVVLDTDRFASSKLSPYQKDSLLTYELYKHWLNSRK